MILKIKNIFNKKMSHTYLIDIYNLIDGRLEEVSSELKRIELNGGDETAYLKGRFESLEEFKAFLIFNYDIKLPRRLRGKH